MNQPELDFDSFIAPSVCIFGLSSEADPNTRPSPGIVVQKCSCRPSKNMPNRVGLRGHPCRTPTCCIRAQPSPAVPSTSECPWYKGIGLSLACGYGPPHAAPVPKSNGAVQAFCMSTKHAYSGMRRSRARSMKWRNANLDVVYSGKLWAKSCLYRTVNVMLFRLPHASDRCVAAAPEHVQPRA